MVLEQNDFASFFGGSREATLILAGREELYRNAAADALMQEQPLSAFVQELPEENGVFPCSWGSLQLTVSAEPLGELRLLRLYENKKYDFALLTIVSELRDRLMSQKLTIERLTEQLTEEENDLFGTAVRRSSCALAAIIERLGDWAQLSEGGILCFPERFDLAQLYGDLLYSLSLLLPKKYPTIHFYAEDTCIVESDAARMEEMLLYLLSNALHHTPDGGSITVRLRRENENAHLIVEDTGEGMDNATLSCVFTVEKLRVQNGHPSMGLMLVKEIAEAHGGRILMQSRKGKGTKALISIPLSKDQSSPVGECIPTEGIGLIQRTLCDLLELNAFRAVYDD